MAHTPAPQSNPWAVADLTFVEIRIVHPSDRQMRIEFANGIRLVIADASQVPLACDVIETLRAGREGRS
jgi:hypothetical protein